jgi:hypothetical protein
MIPCTRGMKNTKGVDGHTECMTGAESMNRVTRVGGEDDRASGNPKG